MRQCVRQLAGRRDPRRPFREPQVDKLRSPVRAQDRPPREGPANVRLSPLSEASLGQKNGAGARPFRNVAVLGNGGAEPALSAQNQRHVPALRYFRG